MQYWLMKSEPETFSIEDLKRSPNQTTGWEGVRNYQARNFMRDCMRRGDFVLFYHSSCKVPGVVGIAEVVSEGYPDDTAWTKTSAYYDPKSTPENPRWYRVDIQLKTIFPRIISLAQIKEDPILKGMKVAQKGQRLSIQPVTHKEFEHIRRCAQGSGLTVLDKS